MRYNIQILYFRSAFTVITLHNSDLSKLSIVTSLFYSKLRLMPQFVELYGYDFGSMSMQRAFCHTFPLQSTPMCDRHCRREVINFRHWQTQTWMWTRTAARATDNSSATLLVLSSWRHSVNRCLHAAYDVDSV